MANITTQTIRVDLSTGKVIPTAYTHQNDTARTLVFDMYNGGLPYTMTGNTVKFAYKSPIVNGQYTVIAGSSMASGTVSGNTVSVTLPAAYTAISGVGLLTMIITPTSGTIRPVNIKFIVQKSADGDDSIAGASDFPAALDEIAENWLDENISIQIDDTLSVSGKAADAKVTGDEINELDGQIDDLKSDINLDKKGKTTISGDFSYGIFNSSNFPESDPRKFNAVMMQSETYNRDIAIQANDGYNFLAYWYDENDNYVGKAAQWVTSRTIPANTPFRLWVRENPLDTSAVIDLNTVKYNIVFNTEQQSQIDKNESDVLQNTVNVTLNGSGLSLLDTPFAWGKMNTSTGAVSVDSGYKWQVVQATAVKYDRDVTITCNSGYRFQVWWYDENDTYISRTGGFKTSSESYTVSAGTYFRLFITLDPPNNQVVVEPSVFKSNVFISTDIGRRISNIEENTLSTLPSYVVNTLSYRPVGQLSKGYILLTCDDGTEGLATYTIPMLINKAVPATFGLISTSAVITNDTYLQTVIDAVDNHGCCVAQHGSAQWPTYTEKGLSEYFDMTEALFTEKGISNIYGAICPGGSGADSSTLVKAVAGGRFGSVFSGGNNGELNYGNYHQVGSRTNMYAMNRYSAVGFTQTTYQQAIDETYDNHLILCPFWHDYSIVNDTAKQAIIEGMIDYAKTKGLEFITMADLPYIT